MPYRELTMIDVKGAASPLRSGESELGWSTRPPMVRLEDATARQEAQIDFGKMDLLVDADGRRGTLWVLVVALSFRRYQFVRTSFTQSTADMCEGLEVVDVAHITRMLKKPMKPSEPASGSTSSSRVVPLPQRRFARSEAHF